MGLPSLSYRIARTRLYQWYLQARFASARTRRFQPLLRAEFANGDKYSEAEFLQRAGFYAAAVCVMRNAIENSLRRLALIGPDWRDVRRCGVESLASHLLKRRVLSDFDARMLSRFAGRANRAAHGAEVSRDQAAKTLRDGELVRGLIDAARRRALSAASAQSLLECEL